MSVGVKFPFFDSMRILHKKLGDVGASPTLKTQALRQTTTHDNHLPRPSGDGAGPSSETAELTRARSPRCWPESGDGGADLSQETVG